MPTKSTKSETKPTTTLPVKSLAGKKVADIDMAWLAAGSASPLLLAQVVHSDLQRRRIRRAHTKDRAEVRGGGKKPWKQKGTGRARHASIRSPLWVGGGTTFGPRSRHEYRNRLPVSMKKRAFRAVLGEAVREDRVSVVRLDKDLPTKTRELAKLIPAETRSLLFVTSPERFIALNRIGANVPTVTVVSVLQMTVNEVVSAEKIWLDEAVLPALQKHGAWKVTTK